MGILRTDQPQEAFDERGGKGRLVLGDSRANRSVRHLAFSSSVLFLDGRFLFSGTPASGTFAQPMSGSGRPFPRN
ncbi:hypothetical protein AJ88_25205 [Mesorhizobium amorphae CCBAU 01583]|nr:hypothetical protein AJ88_25205 [Mesorhizobium amorphae CCBAU 01583]